MKTLSLKIIPDITKLSKEEQDFILTFGQVGVLENLLLSGINQIHKEGLPIKQAKLLGRLQRKFEAVAKDAVEVQIEDAEFDFLKEVFTDEQVRFSPAQCRVVLAIIENLDSAK